MVRQFPKCECCKQSLAPRIFLDRRQDVFELILANQGINSPTIIKTLWGDDETTIDATYFRRHYIRHLRHHLPKFNYRIESKDGPMGGFKIYSTDFVKECK
jgi:hypothetical protein